MITIMIILEEKKMYILCKKRNTAFKPKIHNVNNYFRLHINYSLNVSKWV